MLLALSCREAATARRFVTVSRRQLHLLGGGCALSGSRRVARTAVASSSSCCKLLEEGGMFVVCSPSLMKQQQHQHQQRCSIVSAAYLRDVIFQRPNPLLEAIQPAVTKKEGESRTTTVTIPKGDSQTSVEINLDRMPQKLSQIEPFHAAAAIQQVLDTYRTELNQLQQQQQQQQLAGKDSDYLWKELHRILEPVLGLGRILLLLSSAKDTPGGEWKKAFESYKDQCQKVDLHATWIHSILHPNNVSAVNSAMTKGETIMTAKQQAWAAKVTTRFLEEWFPKLVVVEHVVGETKEDKTDQEHYLQLQTSLVDIQKTFLHDYQSGTIDKRTIGLMYTLIGLLTDKAKLAGYPDYGTQISQERGRVATRSEIEQLYQSVIERLAPFVNDELANRQKSLRPEKNLGAVGDYLTASNDTIIIQKSGSSKPPPDPRVVDERTQIRLEKYVTLDGAMIFLSQLLNTIFGVELVRDTENVDAWSKQVELYHVYDKTTSKHLGSFFLDPFQGPGKTEQPCMIPIHVRNYSQVPVVAVLLQLEVPTWDSDPPMLRFVDLKHLFHEMGHILQEVLCSHPYGSLLSSQHMPRDAVEILPTFMEKWLLDKNTLFALVAASKAKMDFTQESIDAFYRVLKRQQVEELSQQVYLGKLEWILLGSAFDLRGKETIMQLQHRVAKELIPHNVPDPMDYSALVTILAQSGCEDPFGFYSYLWADAVSSTIFAQFKQAYEQDESQVSKWSESLRELLLHPGAVVPMDEIRAKWGLGDAVSSDAMFQLYGLEKK